MRVPPGSHRTGFRFAVAAPLGAGCLFSLICAGWLPHDNRSVGELPRSEIEDHAAGLGDAAARFCAAAGMFAGRHTEIRHQLWRAGEMAVSSRRGTLRSRKIYLRRLF